MESNRQHPIPKIHNPRSSCLHCDKGKEQPGHRNRQRILVAPAMHHCTQPPPELRPTSPPATLCASAVVSGHARGSQGIASAPRLSICALLGDSYCGLGWGRALLVC